MERNQDCVDWGVHVRAVTLGVSVVVVVAARGLTRMGWRVIQDTMFTRRWEAFQKLQDVSDSFVRLLARCTRRNKMAEDLGVLSLM